MATKNKFNPSTLAVSKRLPRLQDDGNAPSGYIAITLTDGDGNSETFCLPWQSKLPTSALRQIKGMDQAEAFLFMVEWWATFDGMEWLLDVPVEVLSEAVVGGLEDAEAEAKKED